MQLLLGPEAQANAHSITSLVTKQQMYGLQAECLFSSCSKSSSYLSIWVSMLDHIWWNTKCMMSLTFSMMNHDINFGHSSNIFHCSVGTALHSLGICYHLQCKSAQAQTCYEVTFCDLINFYFFFSFYSSVIFLCSTIWKVCRSFLVNIMKQFAGNSL